MRPFKSDVPKTWIFMAFSQVQNRIEGGALLGLGVPEVVRYSADTLFGTDLSAAFSPEDEAFVKQRLSELSDEIAEEILRRNLTGEVKDPVELVKSGSDYAAEEFGYRPLLEVYMPDLVR